MPFLHTILSALLLLAALLLPALPSHAQEAGFTIRDVKVEANAANGTEARTRAMHQADAQAWQRLMEQLSPGHAAAVPPAETLSQLVAGYEVQDEKIGRDSYRATLTVSFNPEAVRQILAQGGVAVAAAPRAPVLVLPVLHNQSGYILWEEPNPWRQAWNNVAAASTAAAFALPLGDLSDIAIADTQTATTGSFAQLKALADRYGAQEILVAVASYTVQGPPSKVTLDVALRRMDGRAVDSQTLSYAGAEGQELAPLLSQAAKEIAAEAASRWNLGGATPAPAATATGSKKLVVLIPFNGLDQWIDIRKRLARIPAIESTEIAAISDRQADVRLTSHSSVEELTANLAQQGLTMRKEGNYWVLRAGSI